MRLESVSVNYRVRGHRGQCVPALTDISFTIKPGEKVGVIGPNGGGKSSLLRVMADVIRPDTGFCDAEGMSTTLLSLSAGFDARLSGVRNIIMHGMLVGLTKKEVAALVPVVTAMSGLGEAIHRPVSTYSNGMRARLCFWTAMNLRSDLILIDEVLSVGDQEFREKSRKALEDLMTSDNAVVLVSHNTSFVSQLCDRVIWIDRTYLRADGPSNQIVKSYKRTLSSGNEKKLKMQVDRGHAPATDRLLVDTRATQRADIMRSGHVNPAGLRQQGPL